MPLDKIMPDDINEVACAMLAYISEGDKAAGAKMSYGDFGKHLAQEYGRNYHGCNDPDGCFISGTPTKVEVETSEGTKYELTWNKIAKFIHPYLRSTISNTETVETDTPTPAVNTPTDTTAFDYSAVDDDTAQYLRKATARIANSYADIGAVLAEAQERLANNKNGVFEKWYAFLGMKKSTVHDYIHIHKKRQELLISSEFRTISENSLEVFDSLPKTLQIDISSPSAPAEAVNAVLSGDITTHKDYIALKKRIEELEKNLLDSEDSGIELYTKNIEMQKEQDAMKKRIEELTEELDKADDWNEELTEERDKLKKDLERSESDARIVSTNYDKLREDYEELGDKNTALELELKEARSQPQDAVIIPDPKESQEYKELLGKATNFKNLMLESKRKSNDLEKELSGLKKELEEERNSLGKGSVKLFTIKMTMTEFSKLLDITKGTEVAEIVRNARPMSI